MKLFNKTAINTKGNRELLNAGKNIFVTSTLEKGTITQENFLSLGKIELPTSIKENPLKVLALNYNCDSKVGQWTNMAMNICTAQPKEFIKESGVGANKKFKKAFKCCTDMGKLEGYKTIFNHDLNKHGFKLLVNDNFKIKAYYVSNYEINEFKTRIASLNLNELTLEDVKAIQSDLWFLFRAWQESSIDMTKDKAKQFDIAMDEVLGSIRVRTGVGFADILTNEHKIKTAKYKKNETIPTIKIDFAEYDDDENDEFLETSLSEMQHEIRMVAEEELQLFADAYVNNANVSVLEEYVRYAKDYPEFALTIMDAYRVIKDYNNTSKLEKEMDGKKLTAKDYALIRAVIYNDAEEMGIAKEYVAAVGLGVVASGGVYVSKEDNKTIIIKEYDAKAAADKLYCAERLFGNIIVLEKGIIYGSDMIVDDLYIKQEIEPKHIFENVNNGRYVILNGEAFDADSNILFDTNTDLNGEVLVDDNGVFYLYDPLTEIDDVPQINALFVSNMTEDEEVDKTQYGEFLEKSLTESNAYTIAYDSIIINDVEVAFVDESYAVPEDTEETRTISSWYGIGGVNWIDEAKYYNRNHTFLLLTYETEEVEAYLNSIIKYVG